MKFLSLLVLLSFLASVSADAKVLTVQAAKIVNGAGSLAIPSSGAASITGSNSGDVTLGTANGLSLSGQALSLGVASSGVTGALSGSDWSFFNAKEPAIAAGISLQYWRGDKSWATLNTAAVPESGSLYFTNARAIAAPLTGWTSGAGTVSATDTIEQGIQKIDGNVAANTSAIAGKEPTLTKGNLTEATSSVLAVTGGTNAVIGSGTSIQVKQASASQSGYVSNTDYQLHDNDPSYVSQKVWDFLGYDTISGAASLDGWNGASSGTGSGINVSGNASPDNNHPGNMKLITGTTTSGSAYAYQAMALAFGAGVTSVEWLVNITALSSPTDRISLIVGFNNEAFADSNGNTGCYFKYTDNLQAGNWSMDCANSNVRTEQDSGVAVATGWTKLKVVVNAAASSAQFYINGVAAGSPVTTNIPTARGLGPYISLMKQAGTTSNTVWADYCKFRLVFTTPR